jgi:hypothetical protein
LFKFFRIIPKSKLALEIFSSDIIFDLNEGDSFSDIYGFHRILRHFMDSFLAISFKKDLVFLPQTIGPFDTFVGKKLGLYILNRLKKLYIRDDKAIKLLSENKMLQDYVKKMQETGIKVEACMACARMYEVDGKLQELGIDVKGMGVPLSNYLKEGWKTLSL